MMAYIYIKVIITIYLYRDRERKIERESNQQSVLKVDVLKAEHKDLSDSDKG